MTKGACVQSMRTPKCGVAGTFVCWEAGAYVVVGKNADSSPNRRDTGEGGLWLVQVKSRQGEEDPGAQWQGESF